MSFFFFNDTATTEIYTLSLHDALPIYQSRPARGNQAACRTGWRSGTMAAVARSEASNPRRGIPSVERLLQAPAGAALAARWRREHVVETTRAVLEDIRRATGDGTAVPPAGD